MTKNERGKKAALAAGALARAMAFALALAGCDMWDIIAGGVGTGGGGTGGNTAVTFQSVTADGSGAETTTRLTLTFSAAIAGLTAGDITLTGVSGVTKGTLSGAGPIYTLPITVTQSGTLTVAVSKSGYRYQPPHENSEHPLLRRDVHHQPDGLHLRGLQCLPR